MFRYFYFLCTDKERNRRDDESPAFHQEVLAVMDAFLAALETFKQDTSITASSSEAGDEDDDEAPDNLPAGFLKECILCPECREDEVDTFIPQQLMEIHRVMVHTEIGDRFVR